MAGLASPAVAKPAAINWDKWGVAHIQADNQEQAMKAFGWAQMEAHADLILTLYGRARGRAAEYWGEPNVASDTIIRQLGIPARGREWAAALPADQRRKLDAFVAGMNAYAKAHPERIAPDKRSVLPIVSADPLMHMQQLIHRTFIAGSTIGMAMKVPLADAASAKPQALPNGSNGYAIAPSRSADGHAMLLMNPHLPWSDLYTWFEAQLTFPSSNAYGAAEVGMPFLGVAFGENGGWTHTVNQYDGADLYALTLDGDRYRFDGGWRQLERSVETLKVRGADGKLTDRALVIERSVHGPIIRREGQKALAIRIAGFDCFGMLQQYWDMAAAKDVGEFEAASSRLQMPFFNTVYASKKGNIYYLYGGRFPDRKQGDHAFWGGIIPGDRSEFLWKETLPYSAIPHFRDPPSGFIQNANDPPWASTSPAALDPRNFAAHVAPPEIMDWRAQHSLRQILADESISYDELVTMQRSNRLEFADRILPDLLAAARDSKDTNVIEAARVLAAWDHATHTESRGAVLFVEWERRMRAYGGTSVYATQWNPNHPLATPAGLADPTKAIVFLAEAAVAVKARYGRIDIAFGEANRLRRGTHDLPASGGPVHLGSFRATWSAPAPDGKEVISGGDSFVAIVSFGEKLRATGILPYGNTSREDSPHTGDQLDLFSKEELRQIYFYPEEVRENTERTETIH
jgi:acyl-homoserine-lactone acylase